MFSYFWFQTYHRCPRFRKPARIRLNSDRIRGSRPYRGVLHQDYNNNKEGVKHYLNIYRAPDLALPAEILYVGGK